MTIRLLLSNDDGIEAPGLVAMHRALAVLGDVTVVAPDREASAAGHAVSVNRDIPVETRHRNGRLWGYAVEGQPADCVKWALTHLMKDQPPDLVVAGINRGANVGNNVLYSGTVAVAVEAAMYGLPALAVSLNASKNEAAHFETAADFAARFVSWILRKEMPQGALLNINVPNLPASRIKGVKVSSQGSSLLRDLFETRSHDNNRTVYVNVGTEILHSEKEEVSADDRVLMDGKISITPLHYDLTHHVFRRELQEWMKSGFGDAPPEREI